MSSCGTFKRKGRQRFLSQALAGETIDFEEAAGDVWSLSFYMVEFGGSHEQDDQLKT